MADERAPVKWTQRQEMHLDYGSDANGQNGCSYSEYSVLADGVKTDILRRVTTGPGAGKIQDVFTCRGNVFDAMDHGNKGKFVPWLERMVRGDDDLPWLDDQPAGDIPFECRT